MEANGAHIFRPSELPKGASLVQRTGTVNLDDEDEDKPKRSRRTVPKGLVDGVDMMLWMSTGLHLRTTDLDGEDGDDDHWDSMDWDDETNERIRKDGFVGLTLEQVTIKAKMNLVMWIARDEDSETDVQWLLRRMGIARALMFLERKRVRIEFSPPYFEFARLMTTSIAFEAFVGSLILLNGVMIGWESFYRPDEAKPALLLISEHVFTALFLGEFIIRIMAHSWVWLFSPMNLFDTFLIWITGVMVVWIAPIAGIGGEVEWLRKLACCRILRLVRLIRVVRMIPFFRELWILAKGVMDSCGLLFWSWVIIGTVHFMFATIVLELVARTETFGENEQVQLQFGSLPRAMFTLFQIMTFDGWGELVRPIAKEMPMALPIFMLFIGVASIVLFNLMTAIVVKNAFDAAEEDEEALENAKKMEEERSIDKLTEMFYEMDEDGSGTLSIEEFTDVLDDVNFIRTMKTLDIDLEELPDIFEILDDGDGQISTDEFITGIMTLQGPAMNKDMLKGTRMMQHANSGFKETQEHLEDHIFDKLNRIEQDLESSHLETHEVCQMVAELLKKVDDVGIKMVVKYTETEFPKMPKVDFDAIVKAQDRTEGIARQAELVSQPNFQPPAQREAPTLGSNPGAVQKDPFTEMIEDTTLIKRTPLPPAHVMKCQRQKRLELLNETKLKAGRENRRVSAYVHDHVAAASESEDLAPGGFEKTWSNLSLELRPPKALRAIAKARDAALKKILENDEPPPPVMASLPFSLSGPLRTGYPSTIVQEMSLPNAVPQELLSEDASGDEEPPEMVI